MGMSVLFLIINNYQDMDTKTSMHKRPEYNRYYCVASIPDRNKNNQVRQHYQVITWTDVSNAFQTDASLSRNAILDERISSSGKLSVEIREAPSTRLYHFPAHCWRFHLN